MPQVTCPACQAVYDVPILTLGGAGRKLRCAECKTLFLATGPEDDPVIADAATVDAARAQAQLLDARDPAPAGLSMAPQVMGEEPVQRLSFQRLPWHMRIGTRQQTGRVGISPVVVALVFAALVGSLVGMRKNIVAAVPETAVLYAVMKLPVNLRGLELRDIKSGVFNENAADVLVVQGEIANITARKQVVPPLDFTVRDAKGTAIYSWTAATDVTTLEPGAKATFRRRLASPPVEGVDVLVRFAGKPSQLALVR